MSESLGYIGERQDLLIRQGATLGPFKCTMKNPDGTAVDLTGCVFYGNIRKTALSTAASTEIIVAITNALGGEFEFGMDSQSTGSLSAGETIKSIESHYVWDMEMVDSLNRINPVMYGECKVFRNV